MSDRGRSIPLSLPRRWVCDMLHFAERVPTFTLERTLDVKPLVEARAATVGAPGWHALVTKAIGLLSMRVPELRQSYLPYPWPRLYEAPYSVASVVFERDFDGEPLPHFAPLLHPEKLPLMAIQKKVRAWKTDPISAHGVLRRLVRNSKPPRPIRRLLWSAGLYWNGYFRARNFGTFAVNTLRDMNLRPLSFYSPLTTLWYYGLVSPAGEMTVHLALDHRVCDGRVVSRTLDGLQSVLNEEIVAEVRAGHHTE